MDKDFKRELQEAYRKYENLRNCGTKNCSLEEIDEFIDTNEFFFDIYENDDRSLKCYDFIQIMRRVDDFRLGDNSFIYSKNEVIYLMSYADFDSYSIFKDKKIDVTEEIEKFDDNEIKRKVYCREIVKVGEDTYYLEIKDEGLSIFDFIIFRDGYYENEIPHEYLKIIVNTNTNKEINLQIASDLVELYIYKLATNYGLSLIHDVLPPPLNSLIEEYEDYDKVENKSIHYGKGMGEVIRLYNKTIGIDDFDYQVLCLTKVIEYISPTFLSLSLNEKVRKKLFDTKKIECIDLKELGEIYYSNKVKTSNINCITEVIRSCVDLEKLKKFIPEIIVCSKEFENINYDKRKIVKCISECVNDTRNEIVHAKSNYRRTGKECPKDEESKEDYIIMLKQIAIQSIEKFSSVPEIDRMILE